MRILLLSLSLFFAQSALTNGTMTNAMKLMATGIALSAGSGVITELVYPTPILKNPSAENYRAEDEFTGDISVAIGIGAFNFAIAIYNVYNSENNSAKYIPFCALFGSVYCHLFAAIGTRYIKIFLS